MTLKRLDLFGFKTFADRTEVEFPAGVTAVVGPNGSGKSNISDAILWCLGESNVRHLRGDRAQDVIFAGTGSRKPLAVAEASLTFDNADGRLGMPDPEVTVTRRVYRNGEGEYFINRAACRLKDIHDLFLDTGIGRDAYNMVGQSEIDAILSARPDDRRQLFEEAAGIKKYRVRKTEALRRLETVSGNLVRVSDILSEIDRQVGPLERAAGVARTFRALDTQRADLERVVLAFDARRITGELTALTEQSGLLSREADVGRAARAEADAAEAALQLELVQMDRAVETSRARAEELRAERTRRDAERTIVGQRRDEAARRDAELLETLAALNERLETATRQHESAAKEAASLSAQAEDLGARLAAARAASEAERAALQSVSERLNALRKEQGRLETLAATRAGEARSARAEAERLAPALQRLAERAAALEEQRAAAEAAAVEAAARVEELAAEAATHAAARAAAEEERRRLDAEIAGAERALAASRREAAGNAARRRALVEMAESHEGFYAGVRAVLEAARASRIRGDFRAVADVVQVPPGLETAIETALGGQLQDILCPSDAEAKAAIAYLKRESAGRATFLPLDLLRPSSRVAMPGNPSPPSPLSPKGRGGERGDRPVPPQTAAMNVRPPSLQEGLGEGKGGNDERRMMNADLGVRHSSLITHHSSPSTAPILGWAADLVTFEARFAPAMEMLLGRVLVVDNLDVAVSLLRRERLPIRIVSLDGEVVSGQGSITGGKGKGGQTQLLARKRETLDLSDALTRLEAETQRLEAALETAQAARLEADDALKNAGAATAENRLQSAEAARRRQYAQGDAQRLTRELAALGEEARSSRERSAALLLQANESEAAAEVARRALEPLAVELDALQGAASPDEGRRGERMALEVEAAAVRERHRAAVSEAGRAAETARTAQEEITRRQIQRETVRRQSEEAAALGASLESVLLTLDASTKEAAAALETQRAARDAALACAGEHRARAHEAEARVSAAVEKKGKLDVRAAQIAADRDHLLERLAELLEPPAPSTPPSPPSPLSHAVGEGEPERQPPLTPPSEGGEPDVQRGVSRHGTPVPLPPGGVRGGQTRTNEDASQRDVAPSQPPPQGEGPDVHAASPRHETPAPLLSKEGLGEVSLPVPPLPLGERGPGGEGYLSNAALLAAVVIPPDFSRHSAVIELNRLKRQIADLGAVNLAAEEEFTALSERQGFLRMQKDDLVNAEDTLRRAIREIDESTKETFLATFRLIEDAFAVMFHRLFGGGVTRLELTDPDDILETGIEIIVQPPGKKLQNLQLLSGGERALTASALLFAFLRVKASPFVVLDEVDAPLDEANVGRFAALVREFSEHSQFIVITHNRGTMEAAHALYGVTMQEPGISRLVSLRMEERPDAAPPARTLVAPAMEYNKGKDTASVD